MNNSSTSLSQLFGVKNIPQKRVSELAGSGKFKPVRESISKALKGVPLPENFFEKMIEQFGELLQIDARAILLSSWGTSKELLKYLKSDKYAKDEIVLLPLAEHTITSAHKPVLKPTIKDISLPEIQFDVNLSLTLKAVILKIKNGRIMEVDIGGCNAEGNIRFKDSMLVEKRGDFPELLGKIDLGEGILINKPPEKVHHALEAIAKIIDQEISVNVVEN